MEWCLTRIVGEPQSVIDWMVFQLCCFVCWRWRRRSRRIWAFSVTFDLESSRGKKKKNIVNLCCLSQTRSIPLEIRIYFIQFLWAKLCIQNRILDIETSTHIPSAEKCFEKQNYSIRISLEFFYNSSNRYFQSSMLCVSFIICTVYTLEFVFGSRGGGCFGAFMPSLCASVSDYIAIHRTHLFKFWTHATTTFFSNAHLLLLRLFRSRSRTLQCIYTLRKMHAIFFFISIHLLFGRQLLQLHAVKAVTLNKRLWVYCAEIAMFNPIFIYFSIFVFIYSIILCFFPLASIQFHFAYFVYNCLCLYKFVCLCFVLFVFHL